MSRRIHVRIGQVVIDGGTGRAAFEAALRREIARQLAGGTLPAADRTVAQIDGGTPRRGGEAAAVGTAIATHIGGSGRR